MREVMRVFRKRSGGDGSAGLPKNGAETLIISKLRVTEKGVEVKLVDRVRALESLWRLLDTGEAQSSDPLYQALTELGEPDGE